MSRLIAACLSVVLFAALAPDAFGWGAVRGPYGGAAYRGPMGGAAVRGPYGGGAYRGPYGGAGVRGPYGGAAVRGPYGGTAYRAPTTVYRGGATVVTPGVGVGVAAGVAVGAAAGAAAASSAYGAPSYSYYPSPYYSPPLTSTATAQQPTQAQINAIRQACRADYQAHCSGVPTGGSAALACLQQNAPNLSAPCQQTLSAIGVAAP